MLNNLFWLVPICSIMALGFAFYFFRNMMGADEGTDTMKKIAQHVRQGAMAYIRQQYKIVIIVFAILTAIFEAGSVNSLMRAVRGETSDIVPIMLLSPRT